MQAGLPHNLNERRDMKEEVLSAVVDVVTGVSLSRAQKPAAKVELMNVDVLLPQALAHASINSALLESRQVYGVNDQFFTREGDAVLKASPPYDCVYIGAADAGLLVTSSCLILRPNNGDGTVGCYLAAYFSADRGVSELKAMSKGTAVKTIKKKDLEGARVPYLNKKARQRISDACGQVRALRELCDAFSRKSELLLASELDRLLQNNDN